MRTTHLRQADLNLLVVFAVLAEERNVSRSAARLMLSQPAVSRALQRLRDMFRDDLLVRTPKGYEPTPQGQRLLQELEIMLPRIDRLLSGSNFDPSVEKASFRIGATDYACHVLGPLFSRQILPNAGRVAVDFTPWYDGRYEDLERGRLDLLLNADDGSLPAHFVNEEIFRDEFVCVVAAESGYPKRLLLAQYVAEKHIGVSILMGSQTIPEKRLALLGKKRNCVMWVPYFAAAVRSVAGTRLIATVPKRMAVYEAVNPAVKVVKAPVEMGSFSYYMAWHPRLSTDGAHVWLRAAIREAAQSLGSRS